MNFLVLIEKFINTIISLIIMKLPMMENVLLYLDPGSGSIIVQAVIGALVGVGISVKVYWYKIKEKISKTH